MLDKEKTREYNNRVNGLVAQLGAHHIRIVGVEGSNPFKSTIEKTVDLGRRFFQLNPPCRVGEIIFDDEIPFGGEIRLDGGWVDLISSTQWISSAPADFILAPARISLYNAP